MSTIGGRGGRLDIYIYIYTSVTKGTYKLKVMDKSPDYLGWNKHDMDQHTFKLFDCPSPPTKKKQAIVIPLHMIHMHVQSIVTSFHKIKFYCYKYICK